MRTFLLIISLSGLALTGCDQLGIETPAQIAAVKEAEGRAIGGACRHSGRALEDCYDLNKRASKAAIFTGWRDMDAYMRENNIDIIPPPGQPAQPAAVPAPPVGGEAAPPATPPAQSGSADLPAPAAGGRMV